MFFIHNLFRSHSAPENRILYEDIMKNEYFTFSLINQKVKESVLKVCEHLKIMPDDTAMVETFVKNFKKVFKHVRFKSKIFNDKSFIKKTFRCRSTQISTRESLLSGVYKTTT